MDDGASWDGGEAARKKGVEEEKTQGESLISVRVQHS